MSLAAMRRSLGWRWRWRGVGAWVWVEVEVEVVSVVVVVVVVGGWDLVVDRSVADGGAD
jgi:hypothetical protein